MNEDTLHILAARVVREAVSRGGLVDPVEDYPDITALDRLARLNCGEADPASSSDLLDTPIHVGNTRLYRPSWGALEWLSGPSREWWPDKTAMADLSVAWAYAHSRTTAFRGRMASDKAYAGRAVRRWARQLTCSHTALMAAVDALQPPRRKSPNEADKNEPPEGTEVKRPNYGPLLTRLWQETGERPEYFIFHISNEFLQSILDDLNRQDAARERMFAASAGRRMPRDPGSADVRAFQAFRVASRAFIAKCIRRADAGAEPPEGL